MGSVGNTLNNESAFNRFAPGNIDMRVYNRLPKYAQKSILMLDADNPGYNEPINYNMYWIKNDGEIMSMWEDGKDFYDSVRYHKNDFGNVDDFIIPKGLNIGDKMRRKK